MEAPNDWEQLLVPKRLKLNSLDRMGEEKLASFFLKVNILRSNLTLVVYIGKYMWMQQFACWGQLTLGSLTEGAPDSSLSRTSVASGPFYFRLSNVINGTCMYLWVSYATTAAPNVILKVESNSERCVRNECFVERDRSLCVTVRRKPRPPSR